MQDLSSLVNKLSTHCQQLLSRIGVFNCEAPAVFVGDPISSTAYETGQRLLWKLP